MAEQPTAHEPAATTDAAFLRALPKVELHLHIEGTLEPELMFALAQRNGVTLPWPDIAALRQAYAFVDLQSFLDVYYQGAAVLRHARDFYDLAWAYCERAAADGIAHTEIFVDPQTHTARGVSLDVVIDGLEGALADARSRWGITSAIIPCFLRHLSPEQAAQCYADCRRFGDRFVGFGLDSSERDHPPGAFAEVFAQLRADGYRAVAHAGEEGPAAYVREALEQLHVDRIDHGVRCLEDAALVRELAARAVPLTVCPLSNVRLGVVDRMSAHPLQRMLDAGLHVTINSDDPAYFGGYLGDNYAAVREAFALDRDSLSRLAANAIAASFADGARKAELTRALTSVTG
ncbi:MAG: adenosine deaminase [Nannocystaceae bacterium]|nr:adenosine deaminase [Nannocystaceae bacterium]